VMTMVSATWTLTVGGVSGPWLLAEPCCLGAAGIGVEIGTENGRDTLYASVFATTVAGA